MRESREEFKENLSAQSSFAGFAASRWWSKFH
jgi:hypothetical protein